MEKPSRASLPLLLLPLLLITASLSACGPEVTIPAPHLVRPEGNFWLRDGSPIDDTLYLLGWSTDSPLVAGEDLIILEIMDSSGVVVYSATFSHGETHASFTSMIGPESRVDSPGSIRDFYMTCGVSYSWHVRQMRGLAASPWSETWTFTAAPYQRVFLLIAPPDGAGISSGVLEWAGGALASGKTEIRIGEAPSSSLPVHKLPFMYGTGPLELQTVVDLTPGHRYYWSVRKASYYGCPGEWSPWWSFIWRGPAISSRPDGTFGGGLPAGFSMEAPLSPCGDEGCGGPTTPTPGIPPAEPLLPTIVVVFPTSTFTPSPVPLVCSDYDQDPVKCTSIGCYYWSSGYCKSIPEPPACSTYTDQDACAKAGCTWDPQKSTCH